MNILITGSRTLAKVDKVFSILDQEIDKENDTIIHGGASGADSIAQAWANIHNVNTQIIRPIFAKRDYYLHRNAEMIGMADKVIAFWDGRSRGTQFTIKYAKKRNKDVKVHKITTN